MGRLGWFNYPLVSIVYQFSVLHINEAQSQFDLSLAQYRPSLLYCQNPTLTQLNSTQLKATLLNLG